jgi:hypothetical protein
MMDLVDLLELNMDSHVTDREGYCRRCQHYIDELNSELCIPHREGANRSIGTAREIVDRSDLFGWPQKEKK